MRIMDKIVLFIVVTTLFSCNPENENITSKQPNIIYILADDLGYADIGAYGQTKIETPNIDKLAKEGMIFSQHYSGSAVCAPSRSVLLTGKHTGHTFIRGNDEMNERGDVWNYKAVEKDSTLEGQRPYPTGTITIASLLKKTGYKTAVFGKWGLGAPNTESIPTKMGFDYFFGYNCQRQAHTYNPVHLYENENRYHFDNDTIPEGEYLDEGADPYDEKSYAKYNQKYYAPTVTFDKLISFVDRSKDSPFFIYWASPIPHVALQAPKNWVDYYVNKFGKEEPYDSRHGGYFPNRYPHATYAAMVSYLDKNIGKLITHLKEIGEYNNTIIIFTSDNGPAFSGGTDSPWFNSAAPFESKYGKGKGFFYEGGIRVPMIASWPGKIKYGSKTDHISAFQDIMPTLADIANFDTPNDADGISFYNTLTANNKQKSHEYLYWEFPEYGGQVAVRMGKWKVIWKGIRKGNKEIELYNLDEDINEHNNIASAHPKIIKRFYEIIKKEHKTPLIKTFELEQLEAVLKTN